MHVYNIVLNVAYRYEQNQKVGTPDDLSHQTQGSLNQYPTESPL